jgi:hypothetical protein
MKFLSIYAVPTVEYHPLLHTGTITFTIKFNFPMFSYRFFLVFLYHIKIKLYKVQFLF